MSPDDPRHGTLRGYSAHRRAGTPSCAPCRAAMALNRQLLILHGPRLIDATGTHRRIQALSALGHTYDAIAHACFWAERRNVSDVLTRSTVQPGTRDRVTAAYDQLSMKVPPPSRARTLARSRAARLGWLPPLALDDDRIDDPTYRPTKHLSRADRARLRDDPSAGYDHALVERVLGGEPKPRKLTNREAAEICHRLRSRGIPLRQIEEVWGLKADRYPAPEEAA